MATLLSLGFSLPASAHFQMVYTPDAVVKPGTSLDLKLVFTHPFAAGHTMNMGKPEAFFVVHKGKKTDLLASIKPIVWKSLTNEGEAFEAKHKVKSMGDYVFCLEPAPYYEKNEDCYIQQITKMIVNVAGMPTDWNREIGLPAEIIPLDKPYAIWGGSTFRGIVKRDGKPIPFAEIEVEYLNHAPNLVTNSFAAEAASEAASPAMETLTMYADASGEFVFGIPRAGWWGFCALGAGPKTEYKGKELSQDAVIWVRAYPLQ
ncbi:MAG: DUF4198 domain-containing protein [Synergistota bacterium]|nr:DUF4198 domain-containing protein [Synergistota bacterium]